MKENLIKQKQLTINRIVLTTLLFMIIGTSLELYLLDHYEGFWQLIPIFCLTSSLLVLGFLIVKKSQILLLIFQILMGLTALSGFVGVFLHLKENFEFEKEMIPSLSNWELFIESLSGALPSLAPASLIVLSLIGYTYIKLIKQQKHEH